MRMLVLPFPPPSRVIMPGYWAMFWFCAYISHSYIANTAEAQSISDDLGSAWRRLRKLRNSNTTVDPTQAHRVGVGTGRCGREHASNTQDSSVRH